MAFLEDEGIAPGLQLLGVAREHSFRCVFRVDGKLILLLGKDDTGD
jgi:hypothetical protein